MIGGNNWGVICRLRGVIYWFRGVIYWFRGVICWLRGVVSLGRGDCVGVVVGRPLVGDGGVVASLVGVVSDGLDAAVGEVHEVLALRLVAVASLRVAEVGAVVVVVDGVLEGVVWRRLKRVENHQGFIRTQL